MNGVVETFAFWLFMTVLLVSKDDFLDRTFRKLSDHFEEVIANDNANTDIA